MNRKRPLAVFDLDGTLSDTRHRLHHVSSAPRDWDAFFRAAADDPPLPDGISLALDWASRCDLGYVTGRPERCRRDTEEWLTTHGLPAGDLWMRDDTDRRPARVTKPRLLQRLARRRTIEVVVDDDQLVCDAYRRAGFAVVHADWMPPSETLEQAQEKGVS
jgi:phosphoglycolate phosphatase-like HAD superfamily hydrolase